MAENDYVASGDNVNVQEPLLEVFSDLRDQREHVQFLKEEFQGSLFRVSSEVNKLIVIEDFMLDSRTKWYPLE